jgi:ATP synthase I chain
LGERETFVRGTLLGAGAIAGAAAIGLALWGRGDWSVGFAAGALVSLGNFHLIARAVAGVTGVEGGRAASVLWKGALVRFAISAALLAVVLLVVRASLLALVAGLLMTQLTMIVLWLMRAFRSLT